MTVHIKGTSVHTSLEERKIYYYQQIAIQLLKFFEGTVSKAQKGLLRIFIPIKGCPFSEIQLQAFVSEWLNMEYSQLNISAFYLVEVSRKVATPIYDILIRKPFIDENII